MTRIYVTKYALTTGVFTREADIVADGKTAVVRSQYTQFFHGTEFHFTEDAARADFERRKKAKLESLRKSVQKVATATFKVSS